VPALSEYAAVAGRQHVPFRPPADLGEAARWLFLGVAAWLVLKILLGALRILTRR
jgi:hypothetical protein